MSQSSPSFVLTGKRTKAATAHRRVLDDEDEDIEESKGGSPLTSEPQHNSASPQNDGSPQRSGSASPMPEWMASHQSPFSKGGPVLHPMCMQQLRAALGPMFQRKDNSD